MQRAIYYNAYYLEFGILCESIHTNCTVLCSLLSAETYVLVL